MIIRFYLVNLYFLFKSNQRKRKLQKPIFSFCSREIFSKKYLVSLNFMFCSLPLVMFCQKTNFLINFFPPMKLDSNLLFWSLISLIAKLVRKINSWFHATIEIIKEPKKNIKCVTMVKHQFVFSRINNNLIVIVAGGSNNNKQLPNN